MANLMYAAAFACMVGIGALAAGIVITFMVVTGEKCLDNLFNSHKRKDIK